MNIQLPTVGPIVGYTTATRTRIFLRGELAREYGNFRRCFGVVCWRTLGSEDWSRPLFHKLSLNFDMTGVFVISGLLPDTRYEYQAGWFYADAELEDIQILDNAKLEWSHPPFTFSSGTLNPSAVRHFIVGSCRYLLRLFGGTWFDDRGDKVFRSILRQMDKGMPVNAMLMIGDPIYADDLNFVSPDTRVDQFLERYREAFGQESIQGLMARVPTYMILDDHEIENNWPKNATQRDRVALYPQAIHAYQIYQCSHSPVFSADQSGRIVGTPNRFWYRFSDGCTEWFVMDTRTERVLAESQKQIISDVQLNALLTWLNDDSDKVKFIVTSVPIFPDLTSDRDDKWSAFPAQRRAILEHICERKIRKVVFVSGDLHCSLTCELRLTSDEDFRVNCVISSSLFWPYPHLTDNDFLFDRPLSGMGGDQYVTKRTSRVHSEDNFARIEASSDELRVTFYERKGDSLDGTLVLKL